LISKAVGKRGDFYRLLEVLKLCRSNLDVRTPIIDYYKAVRDPCPAAMALLLTRCVVTLLCVALTRAAGWADEFCGRYGNEYYVRLPDNFISDPVVASSLYALMDESPAYEEALKVLCGLRSELNEEDPQHRKVCERLYSMLHLRYVTTTEGLLAVMALVERGVFGTCPRVLCRAQQLLPVGLHDISGRDSLKGFCPRCSDVYHLGIRCRHVDGAAFGTSLPHLLLLRFPDARVVEAKDVYVATIFGFGIKKWKRFHPLKAADATIPTP
jgi:casein kinase II subunit beta